MPKSPNDFENAASESQRSLVSEFFGFLRHSRKFWLMPLIIVMLLFASLLILSSTPIGPWIYTMF